jgi:hypothetical protein
MVLSYPMSRMHRFTRTYVKNTGRISQGRGGVAVGHNGRPDLADAGPEGQRAAHKVRPAARSFRV